MYVACAVESVRVHSLTGQHVVFLQGRDSDRIVPIWIGADQAHSIAVSIAGLRSERPLTHDLMADMLSKLGVEVTRVVVKDLVDDGNGSGVFHGSVFLQAGDREIEIDSRASDAIALAVRAGAPLLVAADVFDRASMAPEGSAEEDAEITLFKRFIESLPDEPTGEPPKRSGDTPGDTRS
ncbi:MAG: bifunctional nuclease family protein [Chloroflexi bacterium]|nr:bifunctional nuclease family protein [Chloroflexota bacterium]